MGIMNPQINLQLGKQKFQTRIDSAAGKNPIWNEYFEFELQQEDIDEAVLVVNCVDRNFFENTQLGSAEIPVRELTQHKLRGQSKWFQLTQLDHKLSQVLIWSSCRPHNINKDANDKLRQSPSRLHTANNLLQRLRLKSNHSLAQLINGGYQPALTQKVENLEPIEELDVPKTTLFMNQRNRSRLLTPFNYHTSKPMTPSSFELKNQQETVNPENALPPQIQGRPVTRIIRRIEGQQESRQRSRNQSSLVGCSCDFTKKTQIKILMPELIQTKEAMASSVKKLRPPNIPTPQPQPSAKISDIAHHFNPPLQSIQQNNRSRHEPLRKTWISNLTEQGSYQIMLRGFY
ncbi:hypothetical protein FGO68_gene8274 [Halteria grandinella]|uniref:C2 domain-containing protein n=1 Tax=Halteria grandinella TaxID=5974 RepID=A0A8J8NT06_HALGN|nr:hypothetical protein FGO68_gene8274 [Halteria grandinella]